MKKKTLVVFSIVALLLLSSCSPKNTNTPANNELEKYEQQLYASLKSYFDYYYTMDLWYFKQIVENTNSLSSSASEEVSHLLGLIDSYISQNPVYASFTFDGQRSLSHVIIPEDLNSTLNNFFESRRAYITTLKSKLSTEPDIINDENLKQNNEHILGLIDDINIDVGQLDNQEKISDYLKTMTDAIEYMDTAFKR